MTRAGVVTVVAALLTVVAGFIVAGLYAVTLVDTAVMVVVAAGGGITVALMMGRRSIYPYFKDMKAVNRVANFVAGAVAGLLLVLGLNWLGADESSAHVEECRIVERHTETRNRYRYRRKGTPVKTGTYQVWRITVEFADGRRKEMGVSLEEYNRLRKKTRRKMTLRRGLLGLPVVTDREISTSA